MKKLLLSLFSIGILFAFTACSSGNNTPTQTTAATTSSSGQATVAPTSTKETSVKKAPLDALKDLFKSNGFNVGDNQTIDFSMIGATNGYKFTLNGELIEIYIYDESKITNEGKAMFEQAKKGSISVAGMNVKVDYVNGFVIGRLNDHKDKDKILNVIKSFKW